MVAQTLTGALAGQRLRIPSCKQVAATLGVAETKATQAWKPALAKVAAMLKAYPTETLAALMIEMYELELRQAIERECKL